MNIKLTKGYFHTITGKNGCGKTRYLKKLSYEALNEIKDIEKKTYSRMICLAGTVFEKFPIPSDDEKEDIYCYLGQKTNNNMFSGFAPFRNLFRIFCSNYKTSDKNKKILSLISSSFEEIGFDSYILVRFRNQKGKGKINGNMKTLELDFKLDDNLFSKNVLKFKKILDRGCLISDILFSKKQCLFAINDLSSGERNMLLMILGIGLIIKDDSIVFYDEPENSMHPQWQERVIACLQKIVRELSKNSTIVIATHSPLIVSSINDKHSYIIKLGESNDWFDNKYFGDNSDSVLKTHFNLISPRSIEFTIALQKTIDAYLVKDFESLKRAFYPINNAILDESDPLYGTYNLMLKEYKEIL